MLLRHAQKVNNHAFVTQLHKYIMLKPRPAAIGKLTQKSMSTNSAPRILSQTPMEDAIRAKVVILATYLLVTTLSYN